MSCRISGYPVIYESNRRPVTDEEKEKALQLANAAVTKGSCIVVMRPSHVYKGFYMVTNIWCETLNLLMFKIVYCWTWLVLYWWHCVCSQSLLCGLLSISLAKPMMLFYVCQITRTYGRPSTITEVVVVDSVVVGRILLSKTSWKNPMFVSLRLPARQILILWSWMWQFSELSRRWLQQPDWTHFCLEG